MLRQRIPKQILNDRKLLPQVVTDKDAVLDEVGEVLHVPGDGLAHGQGAAEGLPGVAELDALLFEHAPGAVSGSAGNAQIRLPGGTIAHSVCVHLSLFGRSRIRQMTALAEYLEQIAPDGTPLPQTAALSDVVVCRMDLASFRNWLGPLDRPAGVIALKAIEESERQRDDRGTLPAASRATAGPTSHALYERPRTSALTTACTGGRSRMTGKGATTSVAAPRGMGRERRAGRDMVIPGRPAWGRPAR